MSTSDGDRVASETIAARKVARGLVNEWRALLRARDRVNANAFVRRLRSEARFAECWRERLSARVAVAEIEVFTGEERAA
jgi:hypothetical protein